MNFLFIIVFISVMSRGKKSIFICAAIKYFYFRNVLLDKRGSVSIMGSKECD